MSSKYIRTDIEFEEKHIQDNTNFILFYYNLQLRNLRKGKTNKHFMWILM